MASQPEPINEIPLPQVFAGYADKNATLYRRLQVPLGDPAAWIEMPKKRVALVRDLEMDRVRSRSSADQVTCPSEHEPNEGLDADRETATAQATAQFVRDQGIKAIRVDRTLPYIFAFHLQSAGIRLIYDDELGVKDRRIKSAEELSAMSVAQSTTEEVMRILCERISAADVDGQGVLIYDGARLTSERVRSMAAIEFMQRNYSMGHGAIVATAPHVADCHHAGEGNLRSGVPIVVDLFPRDDAVALLGRLHANGCSRKPFSVTVKKMHAAVVAAKAACTAKLLPGNSADEAHRASERTLIDHGFEISRGEITDHPSIQHGTGHGIGLDVHEPILLDKRWGKQCSPTKCSRSNLVFTDDRTAASASRT